MTSSSVMRAPVRHFLALLLVTSGCGAAAPAPAAPPASSATISPAKPEALASAPASEAPKTEAQTTDAAKPLEAIPPTVKLIDAGAAPRRALRYTLKAGVTEYVEVDMKTLALAFSVGDKAEPKTELPTVRTRLRIDAKEITPEGDLRCEFTGDKLQILDDSPADADLRAAEADGSIDARQAVAIHASDAQMRSAIEKDLLPFVGVHGTGRISPRGVLADTKFELPAGVSEKVRGHAGVLNAELRQLYVPFPAEAIGVGATWEVTSRVPLHGAMVDGKARYTLKKVDKDGAQIDVESVVSAPRGQSMAVSGGRPGMRATLVALSGSGSGTIAPRFAHVQTAATRTMALEIKVDLTTPKESTPMTTTTQMRVTSRPTKAPAAPKK